ncbi:MAG: 4-hydroxybenzoate polyprenyltransferase [Gammaproteobacteria bacterium]|jgi:4-hydroxybenzoate polyprenyltransferase
MDNLISSLIAVTVFLAFIIGLAVSIKSIPFAIIVFLVSVMILIEFFQSAKDGLKNDVNKKA